MRKILHVLGGIFFIDAGDLHAWRESGRNSVQGGDSLSMRAGELEALKKGLKLSSFSSPNAKFS